MQWWENENAFHGHLLECIHEHALLLYCPYCIAPVLTMQFKFCIRVSAFVGGNIGASHHLVICNRNNNYNNVDTSNNENGELRRQQQQHYGGGGGASVVITNSVFEENDDDDDDDDDDNVAYVSIIKW